MGTIISTAAGGIGSVLGKAFVAPVKAIFGRSCEGICSGTWDVTCFIEHLCVSSLVRLLMVAVLAYIILLFFYLLFKVGIIQCIGRSLCKMAWAGCKTYWIAWEEISCFLWHKLRNAKRVHRHRFEDLEERFNSSDSDDFSEDYSTMAVIRRSRSVRERRRDHIRRSLYPTRVSSKRKRYSNGSHQHVKLKTREVSVHVKGSGRIRNSRQLQLRKTAHRSGPQLFKRRRI